MRIDESEAEIVLILAETAMIGEGQGTEDVSDCKLILRILDEYPKLSTNKRFSYMRGILNKWIKRDEENRNNG